MARSPSFLDKNMTTITDNMISITPTLKMPLESKEIDPSSFYSKGENYYYVGVEKGVSLEETADFLCREKAIFLYKKEEKIHIVFTHILENSIASDCKDSEFFLSILRLAIVQQKVNKLYAFNIDSEVLNNLSIDVQYIVPEQFIKAAKRLRPLHTTQTQFFKALVLALIVVVLIIAQSYAFDFLKDNARSEYNIEKEKIATLDSEALKDLEKYKQMIKDLPTGIATSYKDIVDELSGVQK